MKEYAQALLEEFSSDLKKFVPNKMTQKVEDTYLIYELSPSVIISNGNYFLRATIKALNQNQENSSKELSIDVTSLLSTYSFIEPCPEMSGPMVFDKIKAHTDTHFKAMIKRFQLFNRF